jgi:hypothetical protein
MLAEFAGFAIPQMDIEFDQLADCGAFDDDDYGPPEIWPAVPWIDGDRYELGRAITPEESIPDPESVVLPADDSPFEPDPEDVADYLERIRYEECCNARFA